MFGLSRKPKKTAVQENFGLTACKTCAGHNDACTAVDSQLATMWGLDLSRPDHLALLKEGKRDLFQAQPK